MQMHWTSIFCHGANKKWAEALWERKFCDQMSSNFFESFHVNFSKWWKFIYMQLLILRIFLLSCAQCYEGHNLLDHSPFTCPPSSTTSWYLEVAVFFGNKIHLGLEPTLCSNLICQMCGGVFPATLDSCQYGFWLLASMDCGGNSELRWNLGGLIWGGFEWAGSQKKHRKNCECCPVSQLIVR